MNSTELEASRLLESGKLSRAKLILKKMLAENPNSLAAHFHLARVYRRMRKYKWALRHALRTLKLNPNEENACLNLGLIYEEMGKGNLAIAYYKRELQRNPESVETLWNFGRLCFERHRWLDSRKYLRRCVEIGYLHEIEDTVYKVGQCCYKLRDLQGYIEVYKRYLQMAPNTPWAAANLGCALLRGKQYRGAVFWLTRAHELGVKESVIPELERAKDALAKN
jgi:Tfp pilus assembly protein PilF